MGCDIHSVVQGQWLETEEPDDTCWHTVAEGFKERNYELFGFLAGVQKPDPGIAPIKGLPLNFLMAGDYHPIPLNFQWRDTSFKPDDTAPWIYDMGEHSFTWYTFQELKDSYKHCPDESKSEYRHVLMIMDQHKRVHNTYKNWRIVIGFDS